MGNINLYVTTWLANRLKTVGIIDVYDIEQLTKKTSKDILTIPRFGKKCLTELVILMRKYNWFLKDMRPRPLPECAYIKCRHVFVPKPHRKGGRPRKYCSPRCTQRAAEYAFNARHPGVSTNRVREYRLRLKRRDNI